MVARCLWLCLAMRLVSSGFSHTLDTFPALASSFDGRGRYSRHTAWVQRREAWVELAARIGVSFRGAGASAPLEMSPIVENSCPLGRFSLNTENKGLL